MRPSTLRSYLIALVSAGALLATGALAEEGGKGGVRGRTIDADFSAGVARATITIEESGQSVVAGEDGSFTILGVSPGSHVLIAAREGYSRFRSQPVAVSAGRVSEVTLSLVGVVVALEDFTVNSEDLFGSNEAKLLDVRQSAAGFANLLGSDFISKLGAVDISRALVKTAGVSVVGGRFLVIRGLADRYNTVLVNNAYVPSSDPDKRAVNIDLFPGSIVQSLVTTKTFVPDIPGESTGGSVNIVTKGVPDQSFVKAKVSLGINTLATGNARFLTYDGGGTGLFGSLDERRIPGIVRNNPLPQLLTSPVGDPERALRDRINNTLSRELGTKERTAPPNISAELTVGGRGTFFGWPAGALASFDYRKEYRFDPRGIERRYQIGIDGSVGVLSHIDVIRGVQLLNSSLLLVGGVQPPGSDIKLTAFSNVAAEDRATQRFSSNPEDPQAVTLRESSAYTERQLKTLQLSGRHDLGEKHPWKLDWQATYNLSSQNEPDQRFVDTLVNPAGFPGSFDIPPFRRYFREINDSLYNIGLNIELPLFANAAEDTRTRLKFGGNLSFSDRAYRADSFAYTTGQAISKPLGPGETPGDQLLFGNPLVVGVGSSRPGDQTVFLYRFTPVEFYNAEQILPAGYFQVDADLTSKLNVIVGARAEQTVLRVNAGSIADVEDSNLRLVFLTQEQRNDPDLRRLLDGVNREAARNDPGIQARSRARIEETSVLPAIAFRYKASEEVTLRAAVSRTVARPSFKEIAPVLIRDAEIGEDFAGNVDLKISKITNYDVRAEWAPKSGGLFAVSGFAKSIQDPIERSLGAGVQQFINAGNATVFGFELEAEKGLGFLTPELKDFSLGANYTFIRSNLARTNDSIFGSRRRLQGQPDYLFNFNLTYDNREAGFYAGLFFNVTGPYLDFVGGTALDPDILVKPIATLNFALQYNFTRNLKLTFRANNMTSTKFERVIVAGSNSIYTSFNTGVTYSIGLEGNW